MTTPEQVRNALAMATVERLAKEAGIKVGINSETGEWTLKGTPVAFVDMMNAFAKD